MMVSPLKKKQTGEQLTQLTPLRARVENATAAETTDGRSIFFDSDQHRLKSVESLGKILGKP